MAFASDRRLVRYNEPSGRVGDCFGDGPRVCPAGPSPRLGSTLPQSREGGITKQLQTLSCTRCGLEVAVIGDPPASKSIAHSRVRGCVLQGLAAAIAWPSAIAEGKPFHVWSWFRGVGSAAVVGRSATTSATRLVVVGWRVRRLIAVVNLT